MNFVNGYGAVPIPGFSTNDNPGYVSGWIDYHLRLTSYLSINGNITNRTIQYITGAKDIFGYTAWTTNWTEAGNVITTRYFLTQRVDPQGNQTTFSYTQTNGIVYLQYVADPDNHQINFSFTNIIGMPLISGVSDAYGHSVTLGYDTNAYLASITDAAGLTSSFQSYILPGGADEVLQSFVTPYGTNTFSRIGDNYGDLAAIWVNENGIRNHLFATEDDPTKVPASYAGYAPSTTNSAVSLPNTFDENSMNYRKSYYWNPRQFELLPASFVAGIESINPVIQTGGYPIGVVNTNFDPTLLQATNYLQARQRLWLWMAWTLDDDVSQTLSLERAPSPDGTTQGQITWYDYPGKLDPYGYTDPSWEGTLMQPSFKAWRLPNGESRFIYYGLNAAGQATNIIETYDDAAGNLKVRTNSVTYATNNVDVLTQTNALGICTDYNLYNTNHQVLNNYNALGEMTVYVYDSSNRLASIARPDGLVTTNIYGPDGYLSETRDIGIRTNHYTWANGLIYTHTDERGLVVTNSWDGLNRLCSVTYPDGTCVTNTYTNLDLVRVVDRMGFVNNYVYNSLRQRIFDVDALNRTNAYDYCTCGVLDAIINPLYQTTSYTHDYAGRLTYIFYPDGYWVSNKFDLMGRLTNVVVASGYSVTNWYNNQGLLVASSNAFGRIFSIGCDILDRTTNRVDANGVSINTTYDNLNRPLTRSYPDNGVERWNYTLNVSGPTSYTNQIGNGVLYAYDVMNRKTNEIYAGVTTNRFTYNGAGDLLTLTDGKNQITTWGYDSFGRVTNKVDAANNLLFVYKYDPDNRLTNRWSAAKTNTVYTYDNVGNLTHVTYPVSPAISLAYDALNRLTNMVDAVGTTVYGYDAASQLLSEEGPWANDTVSYTYNNRLRTGLSLQAPNSSAWNQSYGYDAARRLTSIVSPAGAFSYTLGGAGSSSSLVKKLLLPNGACITNAFDSVARLTGTCLKTSGANNLDSYAYGYNQANQRTQQVFTAGNYINYTYDNAGELTTALGKEAGGVTNRWQEQYGYVYDAAGNLSYRTNNALIQMFNVNNLNELSIETNRGTFTVTGTTTSPATNVTVNRSNAVLYADTTFAATNFTLANGNNTFTAIAMDSLGRKDTNSTTVNLPATNNYSYDLNGNLLSDGTRYFAYDDENELISVTVSNAWQSQFVYDGKMRRRIERDYAWSGGGWLQTNEVYYVYDGNLVIQERDMNNLPLVTYTRGNDLSETLQGAGGIGGLLARTSNSQLLSSDPHAHAYYHADGNGNVTMLLDTNQNVVAKYLYDPFGNILGQSGPLADANLYRFSSKEYHPNSGLYYYLYRFYDPNLQRWPNRDPLMDAGSTVFDQMSQRTSSKLFRHEQRQPNGYEFVNNAPVIQFDLFGLWSPGLPYNVPPGPACDAYGCGSKGSALKWICNHAGNNPWANCVRGCLLADWNSSTGGYNSGIVSIHLACWELCAE